MRIIHLVLASALVASPAFASEEEIHPWKSAVLTTSTSLFGDVAVEATADASGNLKTLELSAKGKTIVVPARWIATLPAVPLASLELRTEVGYDREPWLYAVFFRGPRHAENAIVLHIRFQGGKLAGAVIQTSDGKGGSKRETRRAP